MKRTGGGRSTVLEGQGEMVPTTTREVDEYIFLGEADESASIPNWEEMIALKGEASVTNPTLQKNATT